MADDGGLELSREEREMQKKLKAVRARRENARQVSQDLKATLNTDEAGLELSGMQKKLQAVRARRENARQVSQDLKATLSSNSKEFGSKIAFSGNFERPMPPSRNYDRQRSNAVFVARPKPPSRNHQRAPSRSGHARQKSVARQALGAKDRPKAPNLSARSSRASRRHSVGNAKLSTGRSRKHRPQIKVDNKHAYTPIRSSIEFDVVIEFGTRYCKVGFAIDGSPRCMVETNLHTSFFNLYEKFDLNKYKPGGRIPSEEVWLTQVPLSTKAWESILLQFMVDILLNYLHVKLDNRKVIVSLDPFLPSFIENGIMKALYSLGANAICNVNSLTAGVFCTGGDTAYVVDLGFSGTKMQGLVGGHICMESLAHSPVGMWTIMKVFKDEMRILTREKLDFDKLKIATPDIERVVCRTAFCAQRDWEKKNANVVGYEFQTSVGTACVNILGKVRWTCCEALWGRNKWDINIAHLFLDKLLKCPHDVRRRLANNILLCGGICQIGGFEKRFLQEINKAIEERPDYEELQSLNFRLLELKKYEPNCRLWVGASVFAALKLDPPMRYGRYNKQKGNRPNMFLSEEQYLEKRKTTFSGPQLKPLKNRRKLKEIRRNPEASELALSQASSDSEEYLKSDPKVDVTNFFKQEEERRDSRRNIVVPEETNLYRISSLEKREQEMAAELEKLQVGEKVESSFPPEAFLKNSKQLGRQQDSMSEITSNEDVFKKLREEDDDLDDESGGGELGPDGGVADILESMDLDPGELKNIETKLEQNFDVLFSGDLGVLSTFPPDQRQSLKGFLVDVLEQLQEEVLEIGYLQSQVRKHEWDFSIDDFKDIYAFVKNLQMDI